MNKKYLNQKKTFHFDEDVQFRNAFLIFAFLEQKIEYGDEMQQKIDIDVRIKNISYA